MSMTPPTGPWTTHGHPIAGITPKPSDPGKTPPRARCGGPGLCGRCSREAETIRAELAPTVQDLGVFVPVTATVVVKSPVFQKHKIKAAEFEVPVVAINAPEGNTLRIDFRASLADALEQVARAIREG